MAGSVCKYCGAAIKWAQEGGRWIPLSPETGLSHQSECSANGAGGAVKLRGGARPVSRAIGDEMRLKRIEDRLMVIEEKLGILTYKPFGKLK